MSPFVAAGVAAALAFGIGLVWFGTLFPPERPGGDRSSGGSAWARLLLLQYVAACSMTLVLRWTFAARPSDGAVVGLTLWLLAASAAGADHAVTGAPPRWTRVQAGYWLLVLPLWGWMLVRLTRLKPSLALLPSP